MDGQAAPRPAWMTDDLADEWIEEEIDQSASEQRMGTTSSTRSHPTSRRTGSVEIKDIPAGKEGGTIGRVGTFVVREDLPPAQLPQTPGKKAAMKDMFSPLALEKMFEPPSPPEQSPAPMPPPAGSSSVRLNTNRPTKPSKLSQVISMSMVEEEDESVQGSEIPKETKDEIVETDMPNIGGFGGHKPAVDCRFTFAVPRQSPPAVTPGTDQNPFSSNRLPQAQSTPLAQTQGQLQGQPSTDPRLRLFQFQYDTYTRDHLSALVDSFGVNTPSNGSSEQSAGPTLPKAIVVEEVDQTRNEQDDSFSRLRSNKRIKLTPPTEPGDTIRNRSTEANSAQKKRDYVGESKSLMQQIKRARDISMFSVVSNNQQEVEEEQDQPGPSNANMNLQPPQYPNDRAPSLASTSMSSNSNANASAKGSKYSSLAFRKQGAEMMSKIKADITSRRLFSEKTERTDKSFASQEDEENRLNQRSTAPSPDTRPQTAHLTPKKRAADEKENEPELPSYAASIEQPVISFNPEKFVFPAKGKITVEQITQGQNLNAFAFPIVMAQQQDALDNALIADRVRSPNPTFLAPPSAPFNNARSTSDLNRFVSSSTTATNATGTTLTGGSFVKHAGPPQMVRITPTDLPRLPDRVGRMVYDSNLKRWVKEKGTQSQVTSQNANATTGEVEGESDDPFRDFESLRDEDSRNQNADLNAGNVTGFSHGYISEHTEEMQMEDDTDTDSDDDDVDVQYSTFSFTGPAAGIVQVITGEEDDMDEEDETTDTDGEPEAQSQQEGEDDSDENVTEQGNSLADHIATIASMSINDSPAKRPITNGSRIVGSCIINSETHTPSGQEKRAIHPPRSALKSASVTPANRFVHGRSVSFSDGRKDGKMVDLEGADRGNATITASFLPSARTNRITEMLVNFEGNSYEDESPSKGSVHSARNPNQSLRPISDRAPTSNTNESVVSVNRSLVRSRTKRAMPSRNSHRTQATPSRANATFLTECSFGVAHDRLVQVITDVQPFEPYWESLTSVDLSGKRLDSVARLKEFLPKLEHLQLNKNLLSWLSGIPSSVRTLTVESNALTSLTSFNHLLNLEQLDISYNELDSVHQLACLRHLRELRADGNRIRTLEGLSSLDGLLRLSIQGNELTEADFSNYQWPRLEMLNLSCNKLKAVTGLENLTGLVSINLDNNHLTTLATTDGSAMNKLRVLRLSGNRVNQLNTAHFPGLRTLYVDNNCLAANGERGQTFSRQRLLNMHRLGKLENFSARNQSGGFGREAGLHLESEDIRDVKRLYLSGNPSPFPMSPSAQACYNLVYLELAACRLTTLPSNCSAVIPNVRVLNLNYNFLGTADVAGALVGLARLRKLTIVGNRMTGTKALIQMLGCMGSNIEMLDFRVNPCTLGWYLPLLVQDKDVPDALLQPSCFADARHEDHSEKHGNGNREDGKRVQPGLDNACQESQVRGIGRTPSMISAGTAGPVPGKASDGIVHSSALPRGKDDAKVVDHLNARGKPTGPLALSRNQDSSKPITKKPESSSSRWEALDAQFRRGLPDSTYAGRLAYRGLVMRACPNIRMLDGVRVSEKERDKAEALLRRLLGEEDPDTTIRGVKLT